jgi:hypothetical protein
LQAVVEARAKIGPFNYQVMPANPEAMRSSKKANNSRKAALAG